MIEIYTKEGGGRSSGLGEFWKLELAKYAAAAAAALSLSDSVRETVGRLRGSMAKSAFKSSEPTPPVDASSSEDMAKTPSLGTRACFLAFLDATELGEVLLKGKDLVDAVMGAVRGPSSKAKRALERVRRVGVEGGDMSSASESFPASETSSQIGKTSGGSDDALTGIRCGTWSPVGAEREKTEFEE